MFEKLRERGSVRAVAAVMAGTAGLAALAGCGASIEQDKPATVVKHVDHPAYTTFILVNKVPIFTYHPERFDLEVRQCGRAGEDGVDESGCVQDEVDVSKQTYDQIPDGATVIPSQVAS